MAAPATDTTLDVSAAASHHVDVMYGIPYTGVTYDDYTVCYRAEGEAPPPLC